MSNVTLGLRNTLGWIYFPKRRIRVVFRRSVRGARRALSMEDVTLLCRYTRRWLHYGLFAHIFICTLVGAVEGVLGR